MRVIRTAAASGKKDLKAFGSVVEVRGSCVARVGRPCGGRVSPWLPPRRGGVAGLCAQRMGCTARAHAWHALLMRRHTLCMCCSVQLVSDVGLVALRGAGRALQGGADAPELADGG